MAGEHAASIVLEKAALAFDLELLLLWIPRSQNDSADRASRLAAAHDKSDHTLTPKAYERVVARLGARPTFDVFADDQNAKADRFCSLFHCPGANGCDGVRNHPRDACIHAFPPHWLLAEFMANVAKTPGQKALVIAPVVARMSEATRARFVCLHTGEFRPGVRLMQPSRPGDVQLGPMGSLQPTLFLRAAIT